MATTIDELYAKAKKYLVKGKDRALKERLLKQILRESIALIQKVDPTAAENCRLNRGELKCFANTDLGMLKYVYDKTPSVEDLVAFHIMTPGEDGSVSQVYEFLLARTFGRKYTVSSTVVYGSEGYRNGECKLYRTTKESYDNESNSWAPQEIIDEDLLEMLREYDIL